MEFNITPMITGQSTGGAMSAFREITRPGFGPPLHTHAEQFEVFHVIRGRHFFKVGEEEGEAKEGDCLLVPPGTPHTFKNIDAAEGILHFELFPSGTADAFFRTLTHSAEPIDNIEQFFRDHGMELLGPPLP
jgi:quercetin dioxygenase-like cupin family protein